MRVRVTNTSVLTLAEKGSSIRLGVRARVRVRVTNTHPGGEELLDEALDAVLQPQHQIAQRVEGGEQHS